MVSNKAFYETCLSLGYTNIDDPEQHKKIELLAMELNINYSNIDSFFEDSKKEYLREQRIAEEKAKKEGEEKKRLAVNGKLLYTVNAKNGTYKVYKRPNGSIYSENSRGQDRTEGIMFSVKDHYDAMYAYSAPKNIYTGATVGGVTTGGVSQVGGGYDFKMRKTNKAFVQVKIGDKDPVEVCSVQLSEWGSFLYSENYSNGFIECLNLRAYNSNKSTIGLVKGQNMYERDNQIFAGLSMEAYPKSRCQNAVNFINWYTANFIPYDKSDAADIYKTADRLSFSSDEKDLMRASKMFLFIKDYEDASDRAIATRKARQELIEKKEQEKLERIAAQKEAKRQRTEKIGRVLKFAIPITIVVFLVGIILYEVVIFPIVKHHEAERLVDGGRYQAALELLEEIGENPSSDLYLRCNYQLGKSALADGYYVRAIRYFETAGNYSDAPQLLSDTRDYQELSRIRSVLDDSISEGYEMLCDLDSDLPEAQELMDICEIYIPYCGDYRWDADGFRGPFSSDFALSDTGSVFWLYESEVNPTIDDRPFYDERMLVEDMSISRTLDADAEAVVNVYFRNGRISTQYSFYAYVSTNSYGQVTNRSDFQDSGEIFSVPQ